MWTKFLCIRRSVVDDHTAWVGWSSEMQGAHLVTMLLAAICEYRELEADKTALHSMSLVTSAMMHLQEHSPNHMYSRLSSYLLDASSSPHSSSAM